MDNKKVGLQTKSGIQAGSILDYFRKPREILCKSTCYIAHPIELDKRDTCHTQCEDNLR